MTAGFQILANSDLTQLDASTLVSPLKKIRIYTTIGSHSLALDFISISTVIRVDGEKKSFRIHQKINEEVQLEGRKAIECVFFEDIWLLINFYSSSFVLWTASCMSWLHFPSLDEFFSSFSEKLLKSNLAFDACSAFFLYIHPLTHTYTHTEYYANKL